MIKEFQCGVPQGSLLGPLLFILYINDFHNASNVLSYILFADDSNMFLSNRDPKLLLEQLNIGNSFMCMIGYAQT